MRTQLFAVSLFTFATFISCKKDDQTPTQPVAPKNLKQVSLKSGSDSTILDYTYDSNNRLTRYLQTITEDGDKTVITTDVTRDTKGTITKITQREAGQSGSYESEFKYQADNVKLTHVIGRTGGVKSDSTVVTYSNNRPSKLTRFNLQINEQEVYNFAYDGNGNITNFEGALQGVTLFKLATTYTGNKNPAYASEHAWIIHNVDAETIGMSEFSVPNLPSKSVLTGLLSTQTNYQYTMGSNGQPISGTFNEGGKAFTVRYTYY